MMSHVDTVSGSGPLIGHNRGTEPSDWPVLAMLAMFPHTPLVTISQQCREVSGDWKDNDNHDDDSDNNDGDNDSQSGRSL